MSNSLIDKYAGRISIANKWLIMHGKCELSESAKVNFVKNLDKISSTYERLKMEHDIDATESYIEEKRLILNFANFLLIGYDRYELLEDVVNDIRNGLLTYPINDIYSLEVFKRIDDILTDRRVTKFIYEGLQ